MFFIRFWIARGNMSALDQSVPAKHFLRLDHTIVLTNGHKMAAWLVNIPKKQQFNMVQSKWYLHRIEGNAVR